MLPPRSFAALAGSVLVLFLVLAACGDGRSSRIGRGSSSDGEAVPAARDGEQAAEALRRVRDGRAVATRIEDVSTAARVEIALADDGQLRPYLFEVEAARGRVVVQGDVASRTLHDRVADVAAEVEGVEQVVNRVQVGGQEVAVREPEPEPEPEEQEEPATASVDEADDEEDAEDTGATYHTVRSGESLWVIARRYDTSVSAIQRLNDLGSGSRLQPGQRLRVE